MSAYIHGEAALAAESFFLGICLMVCYDGLRLFRFLVRHGSFWTGLEDFIYWLFSGIMTFSLLFRENSGVIRGYVIVCVFAGMILYDRIVSRNVSGLLKNARRWSRIKNIKHECRKEAGEHEGRTREKET